MDYQELNRYIPLDITKADYDPYIIYQIKALDVNSKNELHNYAFFAWHILWMSFLQKTAFFIYKLDPGWVVSHLSSTRNAKEILESANSPYDLSEINEKSLCDVAKNPNVGFHTNKIANIKNFIDRRDHVAHCSGVLDIDEEEFEQTARKSLKYAKEIQDKINPLIFNKLWLPFLEDLKEEEFALVKDAVSEFMRKSFLSIVELEYIFEKHQVDLKDFYKNSALLHLADILIGFGINEEIIEKKKAQILAKEYTHEYYYRMQDELRATSNYIPDLVIAGKNGEKTYIEIKKQR